MIIRSKAPLRLGLAGGGSDVSPYSDLYGGLILNATINLYAHCTIEETQNGKIEIIATDIGQAAIFESLPVLHLAGRQQTLFQNGVKLDLARLNEMKTMQGYTGDIRVMGEDDVFLGISVADWENGELKMKKLYSILEG